MACATPYRPFLVELDGLPFDLEVEGEVEARWDRRERHLVVRPEVDGVVEVRLVVQHATDWSGHLTILDATAEVVATTRVTGDDGSARLRWPVRADTRWVVRVTAERGRASYGVQVAMVSEVSPPWPSER